MSILLMVYTCTKYSWFLCSTLFKISLHTLVMQYIFYTSPEIHPLSACFVSLTFVIFVQTLNQPTSYPTSKIDIPNIKIYFRLILTLVNIYQRLSTFIVARACTAMDDAKSSTCVCCICWGEPHKQFLHLH